MYSPRLGMPFKIIPQTIPFKRIIKIKKTKSYRAPQDLGVNSSYYHECC
jgi:hypothetical protein